MKNKEPRLLMIYYFPELKSKIYLACDDDGRREKREKSLESIR